jgi:hypothetical protein
MEDFEEMKQFIDSSISKEELEERVCKAMSLIYSYGQIDGDHHKRWVIDQVVRQLLDDDYDRFVAFHNDGEDGPDTYEWGTGIAP